MYIEEGSNGKVQGLGLSWDTMSRAASQATDAASDWAGNTAKSVASSTTRGASRAAERAAGAAVDNLASIFGGGFGGNSWAAVAARAQRQAEMDAEAALRASNPSAYDRAEKRLAMELGSRTSLPPLVSSAMVKSLASQAAKRKTPALVKFSKPLLGKGIRLPFGVRPGQVGPASEPMPLNRESIAALESLRTQRSGTSFQMPGARGPATPAGPPMHQMPDGTMMPGATHPEMRQYSSAPTEAAQPAPPKADKMPLYLGVAGGLVIIGILAFKK